MKTFGFQSFDILPGRNRGIKPQVNPQGEYLSYFLFDDLPGEAIRCNAMVQETPWLVFSLYEGSSKSGLGQIVCRCQSGGTGSDDGDSRPFGAGDACIFKFLTLLYSFICGKPL